MNKRIITGITIASVLLIGAVSADAYYRYELAERVKSEDVAVMPMDPLTGSALLSNPMNASNNVNDPFAAITAQMSRMQKQMDKMFSSAFHNTAGMDFVDGQGDAQVSLKSEDKDYVVTVRVPGSKKNDINVHLSGRLLTLSSKQEGSRRDTDKNGQTTRQEQYASSFQQAFTLPGPVNAADMKSDFEDGVLTLTIPKAS